MFKRKIYEKLIDWKKNNDGKNALLIEGARRVGKSTIVEEFVRNEYKSYIIISFEKIDRTIKDLFNDIGDLNRFFLLMQQYYDVKLYERNSAIVLDEVQLYPLARQAIKTFVEDGRYDYYETGSLISIKKNVQNILIPSEEHVIKMYPMDFEEFLWATGNSMKMDMIKDAFAEKRPLGTSMHEHLMGLYRTYMIVGGMPQAILKYIENNNLASVESVKENIITLYMNDSEKIDSDNRTYKASMMLQTIPANLEKHDKSFSPSLIKKDSYIKDYRRTITDLEKSMMVNICYRCTVPAVDQKAHCYENKLKIYMGDTGLLLTHSFGSNSDRNSITNAILKGKMDVNQGMYFENMVAQALKVSGHDLYFSKFKHNDSKRYQEVDFVIVRNGKPCPVEVKSGKRPREHKSLDRFIDKYSKKIGDAFVVQREDFSFEEGIYYIPIYMVSLL